MQDMGESMGSPSYCVYNFFVIGEVILFVIMLRVSVISVITSSAVLFCLNMSCRIVIVSDSGMFVYRFFMSKEASVAL